MAIIAFVEWQEEGVVAIELRRHLISESDMAKWTTAPRLKVSSGSRRLVLGS